MAPVEWARELEADSLRRQDAERRDIAVAWYTAALVRTERFSKLSELMPRAPGHKRAQSPAEQREVLHQLSKRYGIPLKVH